jgi:hypothetical protein
LIRTGKIVPILCILQEKPVLTVKFLYFRRYFLQDLVFEISFVSGHTSLGVHNGTQTQCHVEFVLGTKAHKNPNHHPLG